MLRSPPRTPTELLEPSTSEVCAQVRAAAIQSYDSDTPSERSGSGSTTLRVKRRREQDDDLKDLRSEMRGLFTNLTKSVEQRFTEIKQQNSEVQKSLQFMSEKYDSVLEKLQQLEEGRIKDKRHIQLLEDKIELLERKNKGTGLEVRNVPRMTNDPNKPETKPEMCELIKSMAKSVDIDLQHTDIKDIYRIESKKQTIKPIIVELNSVLMKEKLSMAIKSFNKDRPKGEKLNTKHLNIPGPTNPIFVSETLTLRAQKLFYMAREFARENQFAYCWTSRGQTYLRKTDGHPLIRINSETDLHKLK